MNPARDAPIVFMFSGQGSQYYGMGCHLRAEHPAFAQQLKQLDQVAQEQLGYSLLDILYAPGPADRPFDRLLHSSPSILMIELALAQVLIDCNVRPNYVLGTSLGEFAAAAVAGAAASALVLQTVIAQSQLAEQHCPSGGLVSILHSPALVKEPWWNEHCEVAAINSDDHFVVAGTDTELTTLSDALHARDIIHQRLPVRYPFHSSLLATSDALTYAEYLRHLRFGNFSVPLVSCVTGQIMHEVPPGYWWRVVREPICFPQAIAAIENTCESPIYLDLGPSGSLAATLVRTLGRSARSRIHTLMSPFQSNARSFADVLRACSRK